VFIAFSPKYCNKHVWPGYTLIQTHDFAGAPIFDQRFDSFYYFFMLSNRKLKV